MGRFALVGSLVVGVCAVGSLAAVVWVDRALAAVQISPNKLCMTSEDREKIASGDFPMVFQDTFVAKAINFDQGVPRMAWWHLRGATIRLTYVTFWSPSERADEFIRLTSRMPDCAPRGEARS